MNEIFIRRYVLEFMVWEPKKKAIEEELDALHAALKTGKLLPSAGYVTLKPNSEERLK